METLLSLVAEYGPLAIFLGTFLEGETIVIVAGFLAYLGVIDPVVVAASAFGGSFLGDQLCFFLGRRHANYAFVRRITARPAFKKVVSAIEDHPKKFILSFRFFYGLRTISPIAVGLTAISARQFLLLNMIAAAVWAVAFTALGYAGGGAIDSILGQLKKFEHIVLAALAIAVAVFAIYQIGAWLRHRAR